MNAWTVVALTTALLGQAPAQPFRAGINLVEVDAVVRDRNGNVVSDLTKDDFQILEDGNPVPIETFTAVRLPEAPRPAPPGAVDRMAAAVATNDYPEDGRLYLLVLDDFHIAFEGRRIINTKAITRRFIERLAPGDQVAMVSTTSRRDLSVEFTADKARLLGAVDNFFPMADGGGGGGGGPFATLKARFAMDRLSGVAKALSRVQHRRKTVVFISEGLPFGIEALMESGSTAGGNDTVLAALREFVQTAQRSNVAVYALDPAGLDIARSRDRQNTLRSISEGTGGFATVDTNDFDPAIDRVIEESGAYYLMGYASPSKPFDGKHHRIRVQVSRPGVTISAREGYIAPRSAPKTSAPTDLLDVLVDAPIQSRGLPLRVSAVPAPSIKGAALAVTVEVPTSAVGTQGIRLIVAAADLDDGKLKAVDRIEFKLAETSVSGSWARVASKLDLVPGRYQVRVGGRTLGNQPKQGSVFAEVRVPKFDGDIALGGLFLGTPGSRGAVHAEQVSSMLPAIPIAVRDVPASVAVVGAVPIKVARKYATAVLSLTARLTNPDGTTAQLERATTAASSFAAQTGDVFVVPIPTSGAAGQYRLEIEAALPGRKPAVGSLTFARVQ